MPSESALRDGSDADFELIETMRWEPALGFVRVERHLERLYRSAGELGFPYDPAAVSEALRKAVGPDEPWSWASRCSASEVSVASSRSKSKPSLDDGAIATSA